MAERLDLIKDVFNKAEYIKTINTSFNELGTTTITEDQQLQPTVEEFFVLYNSLFYDIPSLGEINSHEYLVRTSGEYINFDEISDEVQALQAEIAQLRSDLLSAQMQNVRTVAQQAGDSNTNEALEVLDEELKKANEQLIETNTRLSDSTNTSQNTPSVGSGGSATGASGATGGASISSGGGGGGGY